MSSPISAAKFAKYLEKRSLEEKKDTESTGKKPAKQAAQTALIDKRTADFLNQHEVAVFSTVDRTGNVHGAAVYYLTFNPSAIYIVTKSATNKAQNLTVSGQTALTVYDKQKLRTAQIQGFAVVETDQALIDNVFSKIIKPRNYEGEERLPPITQKDAGQYMVIKITPTNIRYTDYKMS